MERIEPWEAGADDPMGGAAFLAAWEASRWRPPAERPAALLAAVAGAAEGAGGAPDPAALPLGERDRRLLELRLAALGPDLDLRGDCPACGETLELTVDGRELLASYGETDPTDGDELEVGALAVRLRPVTGRDLAEMAEMTTADPQAAADRLLERCVLSATRNGEPVAPAGFDDDERRAISAALEAADPAADLRLDLACPSAITAIGRPSTWRTWSPPSSTTSPGACYGTWRRWPEATAGGKPTSSR